MGALPFFSCAGRCVRDTAATAPRRHAEFFPLLRRVRTFLSETTPRFVTFCECLSLRSRVARGAGMVMCDWSLRRFLAYWVTAALLK